MAGPGFLSPYVRGSHAESPRRQRLPRLPRPVRMPYATGPVSSRVACSRNRPPQDPGSLDRILLLLSSCSHPGTKTTPLRVVRKCVILLDRCRPPAPPFAHFQRGECVLPVPRFLVHRPAPWRTPKFPGPVPLQVLAPRLPHGAPMLRFSRQGRAGPRCSAAAVRLPLPWRNGRRHTPWLPAKPRHLRDARDTLPRPRPARRDAPEKNFPPAGKPSGASAKIGGSLDDTSRQPRSLKLQIGPQFLARPCVNTVRE